MKWPPKKSKYSAKPTTINGIRFPSKREAKRYEVLVYDQEEGRIKDLELQVKYVLLGADGKPLKSDANRKLSYVADFVYTDLRHGGRVVEDCKGYRTPEYRIKKALMRSMGIEIKET